MLFMTSEAIPSFGLPGLWGLYGFELVAVVLLPFLLHRLSRVRRVVAAFGMATGMGLWLGLIPVIFYHSLILITADRPSVLWRELQSLYQMFLGAGVGGGLVVGAIWAISRAIATYFLTLFGMGVERTSPIDHNNGGA